MLHPIGDKLKIRVADRGYMGAANASGRESGIVVEVPEKKDILYFGFHSFAFDNSLLEEKKIEGIYNFYKSLEGKLVYWEALQDRGRRFEEDGEEFVLLNMTDVVAYDDSDTASAKMVDDVRSGGFKI